MNLAVRSIMAVFSVLVLIVAIGLLGISLGWDPAFTLSMLAEWLYANKLETGLIGLISLALAVLGLSLSFQGERETPKVVKETSLGTIQISQGAIETLVKRSAAEIEGVRAIQPNIRIKEGILVINISLEVLPDTNIPQLADRVRTRIEEYLAQTIGVDEAKIGITVKEISAGLSKSRVK